MKKTILLVALIVVGSSKLLSQAVANETFSIKATGTVTVHPLVLVNGFETNMESMAVDPNNIESITVLKNGSALDQYGDKAKDGAILITTKPGIQFYTITDFVDPSKNLNKSVSKIELNGKLLLDISKLLIDKTALPDSMISTEGKPVVDCNLGDRLVINTKFAGKK